MSMAITISDYVIETEDGKRYHTLMRQNRIAELMKFFQVGELYVVVYKDTTMSKLEPPRRLTGTYAEKFIRGNTLYGNWVFDVQRDSDKYPHQQYVHTTAIIEAYKVNNK